MLILKRGLSVVSFLSCFVLRLLSRYIGLLTIPTSGLTTTLTLIIARTLAFIFLIHPIVTLTTEELRTEWTGWIARPLLGLIVLFFHCLAVWDRDLGNWFLDFSNWLSRISDKPWDG